MQFLSIFRLRVTICTAAAVCAGGILIARAADEPVKESDDIIAATPEARALEAQNRDPAPVPIAVARDRAKLMHDIYLTTLDVMHDRYFHADRAIVPARAMEDVFSAMEDQTGSKANWISVNLKAMSINHEPTTEFEKRAAREIVAGETKIEVIENGFYRRAGAIPMTGGCLSCHAGFFNQPSKVPKYTGLVISIPIIPESAMIPPSTTQQARRQSEILHTSIHATLRVVHDRYYREDEGLPIPAAIMGDVFKELETEQNVKLRWLAVEGLAMNTDHLPQDSFETEAVRLLKSGKPFHEQSENGLYRRAAPIRLSSHCLKCHMPDRKSTNDRTAGLIITVPVSD